MCADHRCGPGRPGRGPLCSGRNRRTPLVEVERYEGRFHGRASPLRLRAPASPTNRILQPADGMGPAPVATAAARPERGDPARSPGCAGGPATFDRRGTRAIELPDARITPIDRPAWNWEAETAPTNTLR